MEENRRRMGEPKREPKHSHRGKREGDADVAGSRTGPHLRAAVVPPPLSLVFTLRCGNSVRLQRPKLENNLSGWVSKHEQIQEQCFWFLWALRLCFPHVLAVTSLRCRASGPGRYSAPLTAAAASPGFCSEHAAHQPVSSVLRASAEP